MTNQSSFSFLRYTSVVGAAAAGLLLVATPAAQADSSGYRGKHQSQAHSCSGEQHSHDYKGDIDYGYEPDNIRPVFNDHRGSPVVAQCFNKVRRERAQFAASLATLDRVEGRTINRAYLPRTQYRAREIASASRRTATDMTRAQRIDWRSPQLACRDQVRRLGAANNVLVQAIDRLNRLAARDARAANRYQRRFRRAQAPRYFAPTTPTRVVYR